MNIAAFLIAIVAILLFLWEAYRLDKQRPRPVFLLPIGLAVLIVAWAAQLIWMTHHQVVIH